MGDLFNAAAWLVDRHVGAGHAERIAFRCGGAELTYSALAYETWPAARMLRELGVGPGDRVLMLLLDEPAADPAFVVGEWADDAYDWPPHLVHDVRLDEGSLRSLQESARYPAAATEGPVDAIEGQLKDVRVPAKQDRRMATADPCQGGAQQRRAGWLRIPVSVGVVR